jgi:multisubunit Na+/H+ antiporter MnhB subunit
MSSPKKPKWIGVRPVVGLISSATGIVAFYYSYRHARRPVDALEEAFWNPLFVMCAPLGVYLLFTSEVFRPFKTLDWFSRRWIYFAAMVIAWVAAILVALRAAYK